MVFHKRTAGVFIAAALLTTSAVVARQSVLSNGSMEAGPGQGGPNPFIPASWTEFGENVERSAEASLVPPGEGHALKAFGDPVGNAAGAYQDADATTDGVSVTVSAWLFTRGDDKLRGSGRAGIGVEFLGQFGQILSDDEVFVLDADSDAETWIPATLGPHTAPDGTLTVRLYCTLKWTPGDILGSAYWDDAQVSINGGLNAILNGDFETAGVSTEPNPVGIDDWTGFEDQQKSDEAAFHDTHSVKIGTQKGYSGLWQDMTDLSDGDHILLVARAMMPSSDPPGGTSRSGIKLEFESTTVVPEENLAFDETSPADTWQQVTLSTTVPEEMTVARISCIWTGNAQSSGSVHFDLARAEVNTSGVNELSNVSFEEGDGGPQGLPPWFEFFTDGVSQAQKSCYGGFELDGDCTMKATGQEVAGLYQEIDVTPGDRLDVSAWLYTEPGDKLTGTARAGVKVEWFVGGVPEDVDLCDPTQNNCLQPGDLEGIWHEMTIDYTMPTGSAAVGRFTNIVEKGTATSGAYFFDACEAVVLNRFNGADSDGDFDADLLDFAGFQRCFTGPGGSRGWECLVFDSDDDDDVDLVDFDYFEQGLTGPVEVE